MGLKEINFLYQDKPQVRGGYNRVPQRVVQIIIFSINISIILVLDRKNKGYKQGDINRSSSQTWLCLTCLKNPRPLLTGQTTTEYIAMTVQQCSREIILYNKLRIGQKSFRRHWKRRRATNNYSSQREYGKMIQILPPQQRRTSFKSWKITD